MSASVMGAGRVALVSVDDENRDALAVYLKNAGFDVHECDGLTVPTSFGALVVLSEAASDAVVAHVHSWMKLTKIRRVVVVTSRPVALKRLLATHGARLIVLPAPVFGWELVDALRSTEVPRPRGA